MKNQKKMSNKNITVVIPVHELNEDTTATLRRAVDSVVNQKVHPEVLMIVGPESVKADYDTAISGLVLPKDMELTFVVNPGDTDFASQMNYAAEKLTTSHLCLLEYDDELTPIWIDNVKKYMAEHTQIDMFLPIIVDLTAKGEYIGFSNEPVWANEFSEKLGEIDNATTLRYSNFNIDGMVISKEKYQEFGGLKPSMKLVFPYEFLLRVTNFSGRVMVIPKLGYKHAVMREGSLFDTYAKDMSADERRWWVALAKKEYFHTNDRKIKYEE